MEKFSTKYGHFSEDGDEYFITTYRTPKPWINVISNGRYGLVISQTGGGFSWDTHSEFNRLTRWHQDLIQDNWGKYFYFRDNDTGDFWSPTWMPVKKELDSYQCRHGIGYTTFLSSYKDVEVKATVFVPFHDTLEIWSFEILNKRNKPLNLSIFTYFEWCLGSSADHHREFHKAFLETTFDKDLNALLATKRLWEIPINNRGHWNIEYPYHGFIASNRTISDYEGDKEHFLGNYGSLANPKVLLEGKLSKTTGKWYDAIGSIKVDLTIERGQAEVAAFYLGLKKEKNEIKDALNRYKSFDLIEKALDSVKDEWNSMLGTLEIETPDEAMNIVVNKWIRYQAISGRLWGRTAYYQQSGAFGFRDQLQDSLVFLPIDPSFTEKQIRLHAQHQKEDGTVLHWWHPITDTGLETMMTDDLLWLPFVVLEYLEETANYQLLDAIEPYYKSVKSATLYEHCTAAIDKVLSRFSSRGFPLIGAGDWNDGFSAVGLDMKGESIWLAEFLYFILMRFIKVAEKRNQKETAERYRSRAEELKKSFNTYAWDGEYFWGATKDSGEKILSKECDEGKIYLNSQTWSVISEIAPAEKQTEAMDAVTKYLLKDFGTLLLHPAYTTPDEFIGYLTRYAPARRENGGTYTHAAAWSVWAYSLLKDSVLAYESFKRICPVYNGLQPDRYVAEPYVTPGNIEGPDSPLYGMGGWTWYTGSASWMQKVVVDWILGIRASEKGLIIDPCIPKEWTEYFVRRIFRGTEYHISVKNPNHKSGGAVKIEVDGKKIDSNVIEPCGEKVSIVNVSLE